ncbi:MAG TPA: flagellar hook capping FlgD N-terminal domain-containing protein [Acidimicrobiales bacterium]|nr:flagellar hook capping FlgD N-terminal domain-containing protein [Acidimicrobiales bacterium]
MTIASVQSTDPTTATTAAGASSGSVSQLGNPQLFLQLLIAELKNQDPTNPTDPSSILQQTSELSQMEAVQSMTTALKGEQTATQASEAAGLIGKQVTATVNGSTVTGSVADVQLDASGAPTLDLGSVQVPLSAVTQISN